MSYVRCAMSRPQRCHHSFHTTATVSLFSHHAMPWQWYHLSALLITTIVSQRSNAQRQHVQLLTITWRKSDRVETPSLSRSVLRKSTVLLLLCHFHHYRLTLLSLLLLCHCCYYYNILILLLLLLLLLYSTGAHIGSRGENIDLRPFCYHVLVLIILLLHASS